MSTATKSKPTQNRQTKALAEKPTWLAKNGIGLCILGSVLAIFFLLFAAGTVVAVSVAISAKQNGEGFRERTPEEKKKAAENIRGVFGTN